MRVVTCLLASLFILTCGCSKSATTSDGTKVAVTTQGDQAKVEVKTSEGEKATLTTDPAGVTLPENFPKDIPIPTGAKATQTWTSDGGIHVILSTTNSLADTNKFYNDGLKSNGWRISGTFVSDESLVLSAEKGTRQCAITGNKREGETLLSVTVTPERKKE